MAMSPRARVLLIAAVLFAAVAALVWYLSTAYWSQPVKPLPTPRPDAEQLTTPTPSAQQGVQTPGATPSPEATALPSTARDWSACARP